MSQNRFLATARSLRWMAAAGGLTACSGAAPDEHVATRTSSVQAACVAGYTVTDLSALGGAEVAAAGFGISPGGRVTGSARPAGSFAPTQAFAWSAATGLAALGSLGGDFAQGNAINDAGQAVGTSLLPDNASQHAWFFDPATGMHDLGSFGGTGIEASAAFGIDASGTVVGYASLPDDHRRAFTWRDGVFHDLGINPDGFNSEAFAINDVGVVVGDADGFNQTVHAVKFSGGAIQDLGVATPDGTSHAYAINHAGIAVGQASALGIRWLPVVFLGDGTVAQIEFPDNYDKGVAYGISDSAQVVGELWPAADSGLRRHHAFVWQDGDTRDLNDLVGDASIELTAARAINGAGQIVAQGISASDGVLHAYLLTPAACSEPRGFVAVSTAINAPIDVPAGTAPGDLLIAALEVDGDPANLTAPLGWNLVRDELAGSGDSAFHAVVYSHVATTTEPASYLFAVPDGVWIGGQIAAYHGVSGVEAAAGATATGATISAPSVIAAHGDDVLVAIYIDFDGGDWSTASGLTARSSFVGNSLQDAILTRAGATGDRAASNGAASALAAITLALH
jgi:probable HAF family extracellular repeat protein